MSFWLPYFNYVSTFLTIFDQLSNLVSMFTKYTLFTKLGFWPILLTNQVPLNAYVLYERPLMKEADGSEIGSLGLKKNKCPLLPLLIIAFMSQVTIFKNHIKSLLFDKIPTYHHQRSIGHICKCKQLFCTFRNSFFHKL